MTIHFKRYSVALVAATALLSTACGRGLSQAAAEGPAGSTGARRELPRDRKAKAFPGGADLPSGWRVTPAGESLGTVGHLATRLMPSPDGKVIVAMTSGFVEHALDVFEASTHARLQHIVLPSTFLGMAWSPAGRLYVSGGNASGPKNEAHPMAPIYEFEYAKGRLTDAPTGELKETIDPKLVRWAGIAYSSSRQRVYAANRLNDLEPGEVVVFDAGTRNIVARMTVQLIPYQVVLSRDGARLFVSNLASDSVSVIDTATNTVIRAIPVGAGPTDMGLSPDGRLFVACSDENTVFVIDTRTLRVTERVSTTLTPHAPEGSTPTALAFDDARHLLYIANSGNNSIAVADIGNPARTVVAGFIPTGWYPSALALLDQGRSLYLSDELGDAGLGPYEGAFYREDSSIKPGETAPPPLRERGFWRTYNGWLTKSTLRAVPLGDLQTRLAGWTKQVVENTPYEDSLLSEARPAIKPSAVPRHIGEPSPIKHIIYMIKENQSYDRILGDLRGGNGDPSLTLFGEQITPNQHALAKEYVILDNLYCDGIASADGHSWSTAAYATDFLQKNWPADYGGFSAASYAPAGVDPAGGYLWDLARRHGLTYRSYGELGPDHKTGTIPDGLVDHVATNYHGGGQPGWKRDTDRVAFFLRDLKEFEANYDNPDPKKRLPNFTIMWLPEDHTSGTAPGVLTPQAMVANADYAEGLLIEAMTHTKYWPSTAIFAIQDDPGGGGDHVDSRRTVGLVVSPYVKRGVTDSTLYSTSSMLRTMELLLGLPPMSQYDAAAMPMFASFGTKPVVVPFTAIKPRIDVNAENKPDAYGAKESARMDFSEPDRTSFFALSEILWKSIKGKDSVMPPPVHRFRPIVDRLEVDGDDDDDGQRGAAR